MVKIDTLEKRGIYTDLLRKFRDEGHEVYVVSPSERRDKKPTSLVKEDGCNILNVKTFNLQKTNIVEKGVGILAIEYQYLNAIKSKLKNVKFDLVLYSTPPITFSKVISFVKKRDNAFSYLLLKDIFPQNAVDLGMMKKNSILHRMFLKKEKRLYYLSDKIGCMSNANKQFLIDHNQISSNKIEVNPNSIELLNSETIIDKDKVFNKYGLPTDKTIFIYGGNLGKPQGLEFLIETIEASEKIQEAFFIVVGSGTEFPKLKKWFDLHQPKNGILLSEIPKTDFDQLISVCDVGLIFLSPKFTIPNYPSRLLSYLENKMPVIAATDINTDIGTDIEKHDCGYWVVSGEIERMVDRVQILARDKNKVQTMGAAAYDLVKNHFSIDNSYELIIKSIKTNR